MMSSPDILLKSQSLFSEALTAPDMPMPEDVAAGLNDDAVSRQSKRFDVYRNNVVATVVDALGESFPTVKALVGDEFFTALARAYFEFQAPSSPLLFRYGETFGAFLDGFGPVQESVPYLADLARLEFARLQAYHSADVDMLGVNALSEVPQADMADIRLLAHPSLAIVNSEHPIVSLFGASNGLLAYDAVDLCVAETALILRPELAVNTVLLPKDGAVFLLALTEGSTLGEAAQIAVEQYANFDLSTHLSGLFEAGCFVGFEL